MKTVHNVLGFFAAIVVLCLAFILISFSFVCYGLYVACIAAVSFGAMVLGAMRKRISALFGKGAPGA